MTLNRPHVPRPYRGRTLSRKPVVRMRNAIQVLTSSSPFGSARPVGDGRA